MVFIFFFFLLTIFIDKKDKLKVDIPNDYSPVELLEVVNLKYQFRGYWV